MAKRRKNSAEGRFKRLDRLRRSMPDSEILREMASAMSNSDFIDHASYISRTHGFDAGPWTDRSEALEDLRLHSDDSTLVEDFTRSMNDREAKETFEFITRMHGIAANPGGQRKKRKRNPEKPTMASLLRRLNF